MMEGLQQFWTWAYVIGFGAFVVMALIVIPLGLRDLVRLLKDLGGDGDTEKSNRECDR